MVTKRRGSSDSSLNRSKRLRGPINPGDYQMFDDDRVATARSKSESCQTRGKERHSEDYEPHPRRVSTDDDTVSTTSIETAEQAAATGSYTHHNTGHVYSASTGWECSICTENTTLPTLAQALAPTRELLPWPDAEPSSNGRRHYLSTLPNRKVEHREQTGIKLSHHAFDTTHDDEPKRSIETPADDRPSSRAQSPIETYTSPSLESSPTLDPGAFMTVVGDNEVPSAYVDFALCSSWNEGQHFFNGFRMRRRDYKLCKPGYHISKLKERETWPQLLLDAQCLGRERRRYLSARCHFFATARLHPHGAMVHVGSGYRKCMAHYQVHNKLSRARYPN